MGKSLKEMSLEELWGIFPIILKKHQSEWKNWYLEEESLLEDIIGIQNIYRINHIGSTSVDGLIAKPTIDILLEITKECDLNLLVDVLEKNDYIYEKQPQKPAPHMMFMKGYTVNGFSDRVYHLHVRYPGDWDEFYFRDYLQQHDKAAKEYEDLKLSLKDKFEHDRDGYTEAKAAFISKYTNIARREFGDIYSTD